MSEITLLDWVEDVRTDLRASLRKERQSPALDFAKCGTPAQYRKHLRLGIPPCGACKQAEGFRLWKQRVRDGERLRAKARQDYAANKDAINRRRREWRAGR